MSAPAGGRAIAAARAVLSPRHQKRSMETPRVGANVAVFLLFSGVALIDALRAQDWLRAAFWLAIGLVFLRGDTLPRRR